MDFNLHMNNSQYNAAADHARFAWLFAAVPDPRMMALPSMPCIAPSRRRGGGEPLPRIRVANGGVTMFFLREMRYGTRYELATHLVAADRKWMYLQHVFRSTGDAATRKVFAVGVARMVVKHPDGRTMPPAVFLTEVCGLPLPAAGIITDDAAEGVPLAVTSLINHLQREAGLSDGTAAGDATSITPAPGVSDGPASAVRRRQL